MKRCPECLRTYDDTAKYCLDDGKDLVPATGEHTPPSPNQLSREQEAAIEKVVEEKFATANRKSAKVLSIMSIVSLVTAIAAYFIMKTPPARKPVESYITTANTATGVKLDIHAEPGERVGIMQDQFRILQPIMVAGKQVDGEHKIELREYAGYAPGPPACDPESINIAIVHRKAVQAGWEFPEKVNLSFIVDGVEITPALSPMYLLANIQKHQKPVQKDGQWEETIATRPTCEMLEKIADSHSAKIKINDASIDLSDHDRAVIKEFTSAIGLK